MIYLCTTGTSATKLWPGDGITGQKFDKFVEEKNISIEKGALMLFDTFKDFSMDCEDDLTKNLSAEIHSLARMNLLPSDQVVLFASETPDGQMCAKAVEQYLKSNGFKACVKVIEGLQVHYSLKFRRKGIVNYIRQALKFIEGYGPENCVLNPTGGFKALVPYTVLLGMIKQVTCRYIFEYSTQLITLPPFPLSFDHAGLAGLKRIMEEIDRNSAVASGEFEEMLHWQQRQKYEILFEFDGDDVTLSAIGILMLEEMQKPSVLTVYISRKAVDGLVKLNRRDDTDPVTYLNRVASSKEKFEQDRHGNAGGGLVWLKPGNTADRYLVSVQDGWKMLVWEVVQHDEYDRMSQKGDLGKKVLRERKTKYDPFLRMEFA